MINMTSSGEIYKFEDIRHRLLKHPSLPFGIISNDFPTITRHTVLIPVSLVQLEKKGIVQVLKPRIQKDGYPIVRVRRGNSSTQTLHKLSCEMFCLNPNNYEITDHIDGDKMNWHPSNLRWSTTSENNKNHTKARDEAFRKENEERVEQWSYTISPE